MDDKILNKKHKRQNLRTKKKETNIPKENKDDIPIEEKKTNKEMKKDIKQNFHVENVNLIKKIREDVNKELNNLLSIKNESKQNLYKKIVDQMKKKKDKII